jgi:hypothetical protein
MTLKKYKIENISGQLDNGTPVGTWSIDNTHWGTLSGEYLEDRGGKYSGGNRINVYEQFGELSEISFGTDISEKLYDELIKSEEKKEKRVKNGDFECTLEEFPIIKKSFLSFEIDGYNFIPVSYFSGKILLKKRIWDDSSKDDIDIQIIKGRIIDRLYSDSIYGNSDLNIVGERKIIKYEQPKNKFESRHVQISHIKYCEKNRKNKISKKQEYIIKECNPITGNLTKEIIYFPKKLGENNYLDTSRRICLEKTFTGNSKNNPKDTWTRWFPDGKVNLIEEYSPYKGEDVIIHKSQYNKTLHEKKLRYYDSNGELIYNSLSIISVSYGDYGRYNFQNVEKLLEQKYHVDENQYYDIIFGLKVKLNQLDKIKDHFESFYLVDYGLHIETLFMNSHGSLQELYHKEFLIDKYYKWDKNGNKKECN